MLADPNISGQGGNGGGYTEGVRVYNSLGFTIPKNTRTALTFDSEIYDTDGIHSIVSNTGRLTIQTAGKYLFGGCIGWNNISGGIRQVEIRINGTNVIAVSGQISVTADYVSQLVNTIWDCAIGDYAELTVFHTYTNALDINHIAYNSPVLWCARIG